MIWVRPVSYYNSCCFGPDGFKWESFCQRWGEVSLLAVNLKITSEPSCIGSPIENALVNAEVGDYVAAVYTPEKEIYAGEVVKNDEDEKDPFSQLKLEESGLKYFLKFLNFS